MIGAAAFGQGADKRVFVAALGGALLPDLSLYVMAGVSLYILGIPPSVVFNDLYFSDSWQTVFAIDNSFVIWGVLLAIAIWRKSDWAVALTGAALLHLALDFPLHHDDGRPHFWPISNWVFESPVSYWDTKHGASVLAPLEAGVATVAVVVLWRRALPLWASGIVLLLLLAEFWIVRQWLFFFVDS
ncbi:cobalamin biosynthesis protein CobQ [Tateyamaria sp. ANG-S1]|uniref:cobalamin biosynthesis protein CobQ n=1 Tax=Tateyamaria sp. ANG-S1 TaxID=1577905 RepID=UPI00316AEC22